MKEVKAYAHKSRVADVIAALKDCPTWGGQRAGRRHNLSVYLVKGSILPLDHRHRGYADHRHSLNPFPVRSPDPEGLTDEEVSDSAADRFPPSSPMAAGRRTSSATSASATRPPSSRGCRSRTPAAWSQRPPAPRFGTAAAAAAVRAA
jgi:hypothetical protein